MNAQKKIQEIMNKFDLSKKDLQFLLGISESTLNYWLSNSTIPTFKNRLRLFEIERRLDINQSHNDIASKVMGHKYHMSRLLADLKYKNNLSHCEIAKIIGVADGTITHWITSSNLPNPEMAKYIFLTLKKFEEPITQQEFWNLYSQDKITAKNKNKDAA